MKLFLISQRERDDYAPAHSDTFDSAVVCAPDEITARNMNPASGEPMTEDDWQKERDSGRMASWCSSPEDVVVKYLGEAADGIAVGIVCASFNAS